MSNIKPARVQWRNARGRNKAQWVIFDNGREIGVGGSESDREAADKKLAEHLAGKYETPKGPRGPDTARVADIINDYMQERPTDVDKPLARPHEMARRCLKLLDFFGEDTVSELNKAKLKAYALHRAPHLAAARRELTDLSAALGRAFEDEKLTVDVRPRINKNMPPPPPPRERWLTREEAAKIIWAAWRYRQPQRGKATERRSRQHLARFILVALYTGTRSAAVCGAAIGPAIGRGHVDLKQGVFHRREPGSAGTNKRQPAVNLPPRLLAHIERWARKGIARRAVVEYEGRPVASVKKAFAALCAEVGFDDVSPHTLRHTAITWALQNGASTWDCSDYFGVSEQLIRSVYGKHARDRHAVVGAALTRHAG